jgi:murein DD-endopeptidase MepM/ murein hydrolase activator NlpD
MTQITQMKQMRRKTPRPDRSWLVFAGAIGFLAGMLVMAAVVTIFPSGAAVLADRPVEAAAADIDVKPSPKSEPRPVTPPAAPVVPTLSANPFEDLRRRNLALPVEGIKPEDLRDNFSELRGGSRRHEAIDVLAPRNTPVLAVEDGRVAKLFLSDAGGMTIYQFDPTEMYAYYYAHLERYAEGLKDGDRVERGQVLGYVGTTGNAPPDTPHLHFAIFRLTDEKRWWQGTAIDPYPILR